MPVTLKINFVIMSFCEDDKAHEVQSLARFIEPNKADACGLVDCIKRELLPLGVANMMDKESVLGSKRILVRVGTVGAVVNIAEPNGVKGRMKRELLWLN